MKLAKTFWSLGSILVNITIGIYVYLSSKAPVNLVERYDYINDNWDIYSGHWKAEFLFMTIIAIGAVYFAINLKKVSWSIIAVGQLVLLTLYPIMLGGYRNTPVEVAEMANQTAIVIFVFGNVIFFGGLLHLYIFDTVLKKWIRIVAIVLSCISLITFAIAFMGFISWKQALIVGPLVSLQYLINAYYGLKLPEKS